MGREGFIGNMFVIGNLLYLSKTIFVLTDFPLKKVKGTIKK